MPFDKTRSVLVSLQSSFISNLSACSSAHSDKVWDLRPFAGDSRQEAKTTQSERGQESTWDWFSSGLN